MARRAKLNPALSTLYNAPDLRETRRLRGGIEELDTALIDTDARLDDRLALEIDDLADSIRAHGQRVPILVRPGEEGRFALVYGRRRLEACRQLGRPVRAIITDLEADQALKDQLLENAARRDLSFIERALIAKALTDGELLDGTVQSNRSVAEILNLKEAAVSQMTTVVGGIDDRLIRAIGPCPGIGRPRWEALKKALAEEPGDAADLVAIAFAARSSGTGDDASDAAFKAVLDAAQARSGATTPPVIERSDTRTTPEQTLDGVGTLTAARRGRRVTLSVAVEDDAFANWLHSEAATLVQELHARWKRAED